MEQKEISANELSQLVFGEGKYIVDFEKVLKGNEFVYVFQVYNRED